MHKFFYFSATCDTMLLFYYILDMGIVGTFIRSKSESCEPYWYRILYPYLLHPFKNIALTSSIFMVVAISAERHRAIVDPLNHRPTFWPYLFWVLVISGSSMTLKPFIVIWHRIIPTDSAYFSFQNIQAHSIFPNSLNSSFTTVKETEHILLIIHRRL